jgi:hypothetical protein
MAAALGAPASAAHAEPYPIGDLVDLLGVEPPPMELPAINVRKSRPIDDVIHPGSATEWWYWKVANPKTGETFIGQIVSAPVWGSTALWYAADGKKYMDGPTPGGAGWNPKDGSPGICSPAGCLKYVADERAFHLVFAGNGYRANLWMRNSLPGMHTNVPTVTGPLGTEINWTNPVATSNTTGWVKPKGLPRVNVDGWRAYHDHNWGSFQIYQQDWTGWEWAGTFNPDGSADIMGGSFLPEYLGGQFGGGRLRVSKDEWTVCRTDLVPSDWKIAGGIFRYPSKNTAACNDGVELVPITWQVTSPYLVNAVAFQFTEAQARSSIRGSYGLMEHFRPLSGFGS